MTEPMTTSVTTTRTVFTVACPRCAQPMPVNAAAIAGHAILISIDPCTACGSDLPLERWDAARAHARRLLRGEA